jgi:hypothetical protein
MKKLFQLGAIICGLLFAQGAFADMAYNQGGNDGCCQQDCPCADQAVQQDCWVKYCHMEPCYYTTCRCVEERIPCTRRCCRYVDQQYEVTKCRYVPQYYCVTCCRKVPEYYDVPDCKVCKRYVNDQHCRYVPKYYWKHVCNQCPCNDNAGCQTGGCAANQ